MIHVFQKKISSEGDVDEKKRKIPMIHNKILILIIILDMLSVVEKCVGKI